MVTTNTFSLTLACLFADFCAAIFMFPALSPITPILLQVDLKDSLNIALELFIIAWTGL